MEKLSNKQHEALWTLRKYPNCIVMSDGYLTGGHGIKLDGRTIKALMNKGYIDRSGRFTDKK